MTPPVAPTTSDDAIDGVLLLLKTALDSTDAHIYLEKHESMLRGAGGLLAALDFHPGAMGRDRVVLLPFVLSLLTHDEDEDVFFGPLHARFGSRLFDGANGPAQTGKQAMEACLKAGGGKRSFGEPKGLEKTGTWLLRHLPEAALTAWDGEGDTPGAGLAARLLAYPWGWMLFFELKERGVDWTRARRASGPVAALLSKPEQWDSFLRLGGDPDLPVVEALTGEAQPLWRCLLRRRETRADKHDLAQTIGQWLGKHPHPTDDMKRELAQADYWKGFAKAPANRDGMLGHLFSQPDWATLHDAQGTPAWAHAVAMIPSTLSALLREPTWLSAVARRDAHGRSPWFYLMPLLAERHMPDPREIRKAFDGLPDAALDAEGRGLLFSVAETELEPARLKPRLQSLWGRRDRPGDVERFTPPLGEAFHLAGRMSPNDWAGGTPAQHDALATRLLAHPQPEKLQHLMDFVLRMGDGALDLLSPKLKGAVLLTAMRADPLAGLAPQRALYSRSHREVERYAAANDAAPLKWLCQGIADFPEDGVARLKHAVEGWIAQHGKNTNLDEVRTLLSERTVLMERLILAQALNEDMAAAPGLGAARRARM